MHYSKTPMVIQTMLATMLLLGAVALAAPAAVVPTAGSPAAAGGPAATGGPAKVSVQMTFLESTGATLAERRIDLTIGRTETVSVQKGGRTISAETTVARGAKSGCHRIDVTLRDKVIDATGHFNKTVWQSGSEPCGIDAITLGPKEEVRLQISVVSTGR